MRGGLIAIIFAIVFLGCGSGSSSSANTSSDNNDTSSQYFYTWLESTPESVGLSSSNVTAALSYAVSDLKIHSVSNYC